MTVLVIADTVGGAVSEASADAVACGTLLQGGAVSLLCPLPPGAEVGAIEASARCLVRRNAAFAGYAPEMVADLAMAAVEGADHVVLPNATLGMDLAGILAAVLDMPVIGNVIAVDPAAGKITAEAYNGKLLAEIDLPDRAILLVNGGAFGPVEPQAGAGVEEAEVPRADTGFVGQAQPVATGVDIKAVPVLLSIGRGVATEDNLDRLSALAAQLGAELTASRPVVDAGLVEKSRQVGKSGETVRPDLYIALGISGAPEHLQGMKNARNIVAINSDPDAPIFGVADIGATVDGMDFVEAMLDELAG